MQPKKPTIAYLAPALTALESTFVYDELLALEGRGICVVPVSVHRAEKLLVGHDELLARTHYLYEGGAMRAMALSFLAILGKDLQRAEGLRWLLADLLASGLMRLKTWKLVFQFVVAGRLAKILRATHCQHLHIHFAHVPTQIGMYAAVMAGIPFTVMAHANDIFERGLLLEEKARRAKKFLTISEYNRAYLESLGLPANKLAVVRCGVSFQTHLPVRAFEPQDTYRIGSLGRLVEKKGMDVLIRAVAQLRKQSCRVQLSIAGDGPLRHELEALAQAEGVAGQVELVGNLAHSEVAGWMQGLDAFVLACKQDANGDMDGIPVVLMEAMSQSVPVVSTRLSGIPELVMHEETGMLAEPDDAKHLAVQLHRLLASPELRERLAKAGAAHVQREFGQQVNLDRLLSHFGMDNHR